MSIMTPPLGHSSDSEMWYENAIVHGVLDWFAYFGA